MKKVEILFSRDPYIIHLNIALEMVVSLYFGGKNHVSNEQNVSFTEPCSALAVLNVFLEHGYFLWFPNQPNQESI